MTWQTVYHVLPTGLQQAVLSRNNSALKQKRKPLRHALALFRASVTSMPKSVQKHFVTPNLRKSANMTDMIQTNTRFNNDYHDLTTDDPTSSLLHHT
jgi:hypothetical protein